MALKSLFKLPREFEPQPDHLLMSPDADARELHLQDREACKQMYRR